MGGMGTCLVSMARAAAAAAAISCAAMAARRGDWRLRCMGVTALPIINGAIGSVGPPEKSFSSLNPALCDDGFLLG